MYMPEIFILLVILSALVAILLIANVFFIFLFYKTDKKIISLIKKGKIKEFKELLIKQKDKNSDLEKDIKDAFLKIKNLEKISKKTIQKIGIVRFNPFNEMGGNQSFVIAVLDDNNDGFVISSLFVKESNRVYAKTVKSGKSDFKLSEEEIEAIKRAISRS